MIFINRGEKKALINHFKNLYNSTSSLCIYYPETAKVNGFPVSWFGFRFFVQQIRRKIPENFFNQIIERNKLAAGLLLRNLDFTSDKEIIQYQKQLYASVESNLSHNFFVQEPFYIGLRDLLADFLIAFKGNILIPDMFRIDSLSLTLFLKVYGSNKNIRNTLYLGVDEIYNEEWCNSPIDGRNEFDEQGLIWKYTDIGIRNMIYAFISYGATIQDIKEDKECNLGFPDVEFDLLDDELERKTYERIRNSDSLNENDANLALCAVERAFETYDFGIALELGIYFYKIGLPFNDNQLTRLETILALSAHNRQFSSGMGNESTNLFIDNHTKKAIEKEKNPLRVGFLLYRMAVLKARREKNFDEGLEWANKCIEQARFKIPGVMSKYVEAWALNIRAYIHLRTKKIDNAKEDIFEAAKLASETKSKLPDSRDACFTASVMADNSAGIYELLEDLQQTKFWLEKSCLINGYHKTIQLYGAKAWAEVNKRLLRIDLAVEDSLIGLKAAIEKGRADYTDLYLNYARDFYYRLGKVEQSLKYVEESSNFHERFNDIQRFSEVNLQGAKIATVGNKLQFASEKFQLLENPLFTLSPTSSAIKKGYQALLHAKKFEKEATERLLNEAIEIALNEGDRDTMAYVSYLVSLSCKHLQLEKEAGEALNQALSLLETDQNNENASAPSLIVKIIMQHIDHFGFTDNTLSLFYNLLPIIPYALNKNGDTWWNLGLIIKHLNKLLLKTPTSDLIQHAFFDQILLASYQRCDLFDDLKHFAGSTGINVQDRIDDQIKVTNGSLGKSLEKINYIEEEKKQFASL